jgi:hypothetical protein
MGKWLTRVCSTGAALCLAWIFYALYAMWYWQSAVGVPIEREFGFRIGSPIIQVEGTSWPQEVISIETLQMDGVFGKAGFREGDIFLGLSANDVFKRLHRGRGTDVRFQVVRGGDGPPLDQREVREIAFKIPAAI